MEKNYLEEGFFSFLTFCRWCILPPMQIQYSIHYLWSSLSDFFLTFWYTEPWRFDVTVQLGCWSGLYITPYPSLFIVPGLCLSLQKQVASSSMVGWFVCFYHYLGVPFRLSKTRLHIHMFIIIFILNYLYILPFLRFP